MSCNECIHYDICEIMDDQYGIRKVSPIQCGYFKKATDVVDVVRCRDCLWWYDEGFDPILNRRDGKCGRPLGEYIDSVDFETSEYDFCSAAERREGCL